MLCCDVEPGLRLRWQFALAGGRSPVAALIALGRVDDPGDMPRSAQHEAHRPAEDARGFIRGFPRHDVIFTRGVHIGRQLHRLQVQRHPGHGERAGLAHLVFEIGVAQIPGKQRPRQIGRIGIPVQQIERRRRFALEVIADDVIPHQIVRSQAGKSRGQFTPGHQPALAQRGFAQGHRGFIDVNAQNACIGEIDHRGQQGRAMGELFAPRLQHRQRVGQQGAAYAEPQGIDGAIAALRRDVAHHLHGANHAVLHIIVPGQVAHAGVRVAPRHDESPVPLLDRKPHQRVVGLQIEDVVLVDRRRHEQQRPRMHALGQRGVLDELEQIVFKHHLACGSCHVAAHLENRFIGLRHSTLFQVLEPIFYAGAQAFPLRLHRFLKGLGIERQKVGRRRRIDPLLHREAQLLPRRLVGLHVFGQIEQGPRAQ